MGGRGSARKSSTTPSGKTLSEYQGMSVADLGAFFRSLDKIDYPDQLSNNALQKIVYALGMNDKPDIVSDEELDKMIADGATEIFRSVEEDKWHEEMLDGDLSWMGYGKYGDGLYFGNVADDTIAFGPSRIRGVLNKNAKIVDYDEVTAWQQASYNAASGVDSSAPEQLRRNANAAAKLTYGADGGWNPNASISALHMGYNVIRVPDAGGPNSDFYVVLDRKALTMSRTIEHTWVE